MAWQGNLVWRSQIVYRMYLDGHHELPLIRIQRRSLGTIRPDVIGRGIATATVQQLRLVASHHARPH